MTQFLRLLAEDDKAQALLETCTRLRAGEDDPRHFEVTPDAFDAVPGKPFAYWVSNSILQVYRTLPQFLGEGREARQGASSTSAFRYIRIWTEPDAARVASDFDQARIGSSGWVPYPFDPLPPKSPGMLPDDAEPFHAHPGILVDDPGHPHDLARLTELRDTLLKLAPGYRPNQDDGVQITAAPLWPLFRHKPWQKVLKDTWNKLQKGDYDWSHLAMAYWPERVREACKTDKSLAIAHGLESLYVEPAAKPKKGRKRSG